MSVKLSKERLIEELERLQKELEIIPTKHHLNKLISTYDKTNQSWLYQLDALLQHQIYKDFAKTSITDVSPFPNVIEFINKYKTMRASLEWKISKLRTAIDTYDENDLNLEVTDGESNHEKIIEAYLRRKEQNSWGIDNGTGTPKNERRPFTSW